MTLQEKIGQKLMGGFSGTEMSGEFIRLVKTYKIGNVILFRHNIVDCTQLKRLCEEIQDLVLAETGHRAFIGIDQEGGCVTRLPEDAVNVPGEMAIAASGDKENARIAAGLTARELRALGINFNFAPVVDINNNPNNPIIGARCFGDTPEQVAAYAKEALLGYQENGLLAAAKHFPGHGDTESDSHISLPKVEKTVGQLKSMELKPFEAMVKAGCPAIMIAHILFPALDPEPVPATMSRRIVTDLLKMVMSFQGLVVSDCMEMDAIRKYYGTAFGAAEAMKAGVDLILVSHTEALLEEAFLRMQEAAEKGEVPMEELDASVEKILRFKERYCLPPDGEAGNPEAKAISRSLREKSLVLVGERLPRLGEHPLFISCPEYQAGLVSNEEEKKESFAEFMARRLGGEGLVTGRDPEKQEISAIVSAAAGRSALVLGTYNGHLFPGQMALIQALGGTGLPLVVVALRNPYDLKALPPHAAGIAAWDYSTMTLEALVPVLAGERLPSGKMPVRLD